MSAERRTADALSDALAASGSGTDLEAVTRPLLEALQAATGLSSTYLTTIDLERSEQHIRYALNSGSIEIPEGLTVEWADTLCRRALESGQVVTDDVPSIWGDSEAAAELGIRTYVSSPVSLPDGDIVGTLCGASGEQVEVDERTVALLRSFSRLIADAIMRERAVEASEARARQAEARLAERATFLAVAEHKLKTPIVIVDGWARLLREGKLEEDEVDAALTAIIDSAERLNSGLKEMLGEAAAQVVASELRLERLDLAEILEPVVSRLDRLSDAHPIVLDVPAGSEATVDAGALRIVVEHLVDNAITYSPDGGEVTIAKADAPPGFVGLVVRDRGLGIPEGADIFGAFTRGHTEIPGTGLGLHIVASLVGSMRGHVSAERWAEGSELTLHLRA